MDTNFIVYAHYTKSDNRLFYIGEGRLKRVYSIHSRNKYWKNIVNKNGFYVKILYKNLSKQKAENIETRLIRNLKKRGVNLANFCIGPMYKNHWLLNAPKERHPMFGKKSPNSSKRITEWNKNHSGVNSPTFGKKRPDLAERNKSGLFRRKLIPVRCIETNEIFSSISEAQLKYPSKHYARNIRKNWSICGLHFAYL
ncbi:MAG TPA: hypothetical protein PKD00_10545 [Burkholderiales bacterium]|nr:hypothetical protein [Burkholderiales bacterium]